MMHQRGTASGSSEMTQTSDHIDPPRDFVNSQHEKSKPMASFLYNKHVLPAAIPGLLFIFTMAGELLLAILTVGALAIYLMVSGDAPQNAVIAYICTFVASQMAVLYSCLPLIWISIFNIPLLMLLNMFLGLTGVWGLIQFPFFISNQPILSQTIEMGLFSLYPLVSVGLVTWLLAYLTSVRFALYVAVFYGFLLLRIFLKPAISSFYKLNPEQSRRSQILGRAEAAAVLIVYVGFPFLLYLTSHIMEMLHANILTLVELLLIACLPSFLATLIQLRGLYEQFNITVNQVIYARIILGFVSLILSCWIAQQLGLSSATSWLFPAIASYTLLGFSLSKGRRFLVASTLLTLGTVFITSYAIYQVVPLSLMIPSVSTLPLTLLLVLNATVSVACVLLARTKYSNLSLCILLQAALLVHSECFLLSLGLYMQFLAVLTFLLQMYLIARLHASSKVTHHCLWLCGTIHSMKLPFCFEYILKISENKASIGILSSYSCVALIGITLRILIYENQEQLSPKEILRYLFFSAVSVPTFILNVMQPVFLQVLDVNFVAVLFTDLMVTSAFAFKLTKCNMKQNLNGFKVSGVMFFVSGISLLMQAPVIKERMSLWSVLMIEMAAVLLLSSSCSLIHPPHPRPYAFVGGLLIGIPIGVIIHQFIEPFGGLLSIVAYAALCVEVFTIILLLWRYSIEWKDRNLTQCAKDLFLHGTFVAFFIISLSVFLNDLCNLTKSSWWNAVSQVPSTSLLCTISGILSLTIRLFCLKWQQQNPFSYKPGLIPTYGNILTIMTYLLAIISNPLPFPEIWNSVASIVFLFFQQDLKIFPNFRAPMRTGTIFAVCMSQFLFFSFKYSIMWTEGIGVFAILEVLTLPLSIPLLIVMTIVLSQPLKFTIPEQTVILCTPLPVLVFTLGSSYASWVHAGTSFGCGVWLLQKTSFGLQ
ncbi:uncharacterized protein LOC129254677 [Lytechinus pictus]|uniref:uncharacterized protein LOC129254677 n=1 Tax=Lytechinus pictus TaxID=7653 RepID=UPI0030BA020F